MKKRRPKPNLKMSKKMKNKLKIIKTLLEMIPIIIPIQVPMIGIRTLPMGKPKNRLSEEKKWAFWNFLVTKLMFSLKLITKIPTNQRQKSPSDIFVICSNHISFTYSPYAIIISYSPKVTAGLNFCGSIIPSIMCFFYFFVGCNIRV